MDEGRERNDVSLPNPRSPSTTHSPSHHSQLPGPTRWKHEPRPWPRHRHNLHASHLLLFLLLTCCVSLSTASKVYIEESMVEVEVQTAASDRPSSQDRLAQTGPILVDQRPPPDPKSWTLATEHDDLQRLQRRGDPLGSGNQNQDADDDKSSSSSSSSSMITTAVRPSSTKGAKTSETSTAPLTIATPVGSPSPLPSPFDQGFNGNITESCSTFMYSFLTNATFKACLPFSLLLLTSNTFFQASKSVTRITQTLDATCAADLQTCEPLIASLATNLTESANCASDLNSQNPLIVQAQLGLLAYKPLYTAGCLRSPQNSYCFADAVTNASAPTDSYIYYLPLNISLPAGFQPTCDECLRDTMAVFEGASADRSAAIAGDYLDAAQQVNLQCGPGYVAQTLAPAIKSSGTSVHVSASYLGGVLALVGLAAGCLL